MKIIRSKFFLGLFSIATIAAFLLGWSGNGSAAVSGSEGNGAGSEATQTADAGDSFVLDGYNAIKFGMNVIELKNMGYKCPNYSKTICRLDYGIQNNETLLGKEANLMVWVDKNEVRRIDVSIDVKPKEMLNYFTESLGEPEVIRYISLTNNLMEAYYWVSSNGSSMSMTRDFGKMAKTTGDEVETASSTIKYQSEERTLKSIADVKQRELPAGENLIGHR